MDKSCKGFSGTNICIVEQLGFAIIFLFLYSSNASGLTSGTTNGTSGSILKKEVLSITIQPFSPAIGAQTSDTLEPAEKRAISTSEKSNFSTSCTFKTWSPKLTSLPTDLLEAKAKILFIGNEYFYNGKKINILDRLPEIIKKVPSIKKIIIVQYPGTEINKKKHQN